MRGRGMERLKLLISWNESAVRVAFCRRRQKATS